MSNASIAQRILEIVRAFERGECSAISITYSIELHAPAFEGIKRATRDRLDKLSIEVIHQDVSPFETELLGFQPSRAAITELKDLLKEIAGRPD